MTINARITTSERDAAILRHLLSADLELARVLQRYGAVGNLIVARQRLAAARVLMEPAVEEEWTTEQILESEG